MISRALKDLSEKVLGKLSSKPAGFLDNYPEGAVLVSPDGIVLANNKAGATLAALITAGTQQPLQELIQKVLNGPGANLDGIVIDKSAQLDVSAMAVQDGEAVLLLAHDQTFARNMLSALVDSRARYKDLVDVSSDFAWEIGPDGTFIFISPGGALDYTADDFMGKGPNDFGLIPVKSREVSPFLGTEPTTDIDVHMRRADGMVAQLKVSALPLFNHAGGWMGSRGVCRDVTEDSLRKAALIEARIREKLLKHLVGIIRDEVEPFKTLTGSIEYIVRASSFAGCKIYTRDEYSDLGNKFVRAAHVGSEEFMPPDDEVFPLIEKTEGTQPISGKGWSGLLATTGYRHHVNGAICVWQAGLPDEWTEDEIALIDTVSDQLGIAIERVMHHERILRLSRTDELTGLLNRRAFLEEELPRRMERLQHSGGTAALLFVDLDNFKLVNDVHGHHKGDEVLVMLARFLEKHSRPGDAIARFGGDEFAVWLDGMDAKGAGQRAAAMIKDSQVFKEHSGEDAHPLGLSIGVSMYNSENQEPLEHLMSRADEAMYKVKREGKGGFAFERSIERQESKTGETKIDRLEP